MAAFFLFPQSVRAATDCTVSQSAIDFAEARAVETRHGRAHVEKWARVLIAFGEDPGVLDLTPFFSVESSRALEPMTADEAEDPGQIAARHTAIHEALARMDQCRAPEGETVDPPVPQQQQQGLAPGSCLRNHHTNLTVSESNGAYTTSFMESSDNGFDCRFSLPTGWFSGVADKTYDTTALGISRIVTLKTETPGGVVSHRRLHIVVRNINDNVYTGDRSFVINTTNAKDGTTNAGHSITVVIVDDESDAVGFTADEYTVREPDGPAEVTVELAAARAADLTVGLTTAPNTACGGEDEHTFTEHGNTKTVVCHDADDTANPNNGADPDSPGRVDYTKLEDHTVTIAAGSTTATAQITIIDDRVLEGGSLADTGEEFTVQVTSVGGTSVTDGATAKVIIIDDERTITPEFAQYAVNERDGYLKVTLRASRAWAVDKVVALSGDDLTGQTLSYASLPTQVTMPADATETSFFISISYGQIQTNRLFRVTVGDKGSCSDTVYVIEDGCTGAGETWTHGDLNHRQSPPVFDVTVLVDDPSGLAACNFPEELSENEQGLQEGACAIPAGTHVPGDAANKWGIEYTIKADVIQGCNDLRYTTQSDCETNGNSWSETGVDGVLRWSGYAEDDNIVAHRVVRTRKAVTGSDGFRIGVENDIIKIVNEDVNRIYVDMLGWKSNNLRVRLNTGRKTHVNPVVACRNFILDGLTCTGAGGTPNTSFMVGLGTDWRKSDHLVTDPGFLNSPRSLQQSPAVSRGYEEVTMKIDRFTTKTCNQEILPDVELYLGNYGRWEENGNRQTQVCSDPQYRDRLSCENAGETWPDALPSTLKIGHVYVDDDSSAHPMSEHIKFSYLDPADSRGDTEARWSNGAIRLCD